MKNKIMSTNNAMGIDRIKQEDVVLRYLNEIIEKEELTLASLENEMNTTNMEIKNASLLLEMYDTKESSRSFFEPDNTIEDKKYIKKINDNYIHQIKVMEKQKENYTLSNEKILYLNEIKSFIESKMNEKKIEKNNDRINTGNKLNILEAQEMERGRIARDLHDSTVQSLTNMIHRTELCINLMDIDIIRAKLELIGMTTLLKSIINDMRGIIYDLRPMSLEDLGLGITINRLFTKIKETKLIKTELTIEPEEKKLPPIITLTVYRIIQEACNNIIKHSDAKKIEINITFHVDEIIITVYDDGKGFQIDEIEGERENGHELGLSIMKERTKLLSGELLIDTSLGSGTKITITIPILEEEKEREEADE